MVTRRVSRLMDAEIPHNFSSDPQKFGKKAGEPAIDLPWQQARVAGKNPEPRASSRVRNAAGAVGSQFPGFAVVIHILYSEYDRVSAAASVA